MKHVHGLVLMVSFGLLSSLAAQEGPHTLKLRRPAAGEKFRETITDVTTKSMVLMVKGQNQTKESKVTTELVFVEEVLEREPELKKPTKAKRVYEKAQQTEGGITKDLGLTGKTLLIEKGETKYRYTLDGAELGEGPALDLLRREFDRSSTLTEESLLPPQPVKVNDTWKIDTKKLVEDLATSNIIADPNSAMSSAKLTGWTVKDGKNRGSMIIEMTVKLQMIKEPQRDVPLQDSKVTLRMELTGCLDGTESYIAGKVETSSDITVLQPQGQVNIVNKSIRMGKTEPLPK